MYRTKKFNLSSERAIADRGTAHSNRPKLLLMVGEDLSMGWNVILWLLLLDGLLEAAGHISTKYQRISGSEGLLCLFNDIQSLYAVCFKL